MCQGSSSESSNSSKLQLKVYAKVDAKPVARENAIPLVVSVTAPADVAERVPLDVVAVLHVDSRSRLPAYWRELLMNAMKLVIDRLDGNDKLAILPVHPTFQGMSPEGKREASAALQSQEMRKDTPIGNALQAADKMIYAREDGYDREGVIILISNNYKNTTSGNIRYKVHAFGIHGAHDAWDMLSLGMRTGGVYAVLNDDHGSITEAFTSSIHRLTSTIAVQASVNFSHNNENSVKAFQYRAPWDYEELMELYSMHHRGATRNLVWYVEGLQENQYSDFPKLSAIDLSYCPRPGSKLVWGETIHGQVLVVKKGDQASNEVAAEIVRFDTLNAVLEILISVSQNTSWEELEHGADELRKQWRSVQDSDHGREASVAGLILGLAMEVREMEARLRSNNSWKEYMCSWVGQQFLGRLPLTPPIHKGDYSGSEVASPLQRPRIFVRQLADTVSRPTTEQHQAIPVLVQVVAPASTGAMERAHVNLVAVLDVSYGAKKPTSRKMELLNKSIELVMNRLSDKDCLAIIPVHSSDAQPTTGLLEMSEQGRDAISAMMRSLSAAPAKNTAVQASHGRESLKKAVKKILTSNCFSVASGSQNTSETMTPSLGESGSTELWKALTDAVELLDGRRRQGIDRVGLIILISDGGDNPSIVHGTLGGGYTVHAFGFRDAHNAMALHRIASSSGGIYAVLNTEDGRVTKAFDVCIDKISSIVASQLQVDIRCSDWSGVTLSAIESGQLISGISHDRKLGYVMVGNLDHGAMRKFIICLDNNVHDDDDNDDDDDDKDEDESFPGLFVTARVRYTLAGWMEMQQNQVYLHAPEDDPQASSDFAAAMVHAKAVGMVSKIAQKYGGNSVTMDDNRFQAAKELDAGWRSIKASKNAQAAGEAKLAGLARDIQEIKASLTMDTGLPLPHMLSWLSFQMICEQIPSEREVNPVEYSPGSHGSDAGLPPLWLKQG